MPTLPLLAGVSGWSHPLWDRLVLPHSSSSKHPLDFLSQRLDCIELPNTRQQFLRPELARLWAAKVAHNPRFRFSALLHDQFVQDRNLDPAAVQAWKEGVRPLLQAGRLGAVVMEFPLSFRFTRENRDFLIQLRRTFHEFPLAAELPHNSWTSREARSALIDYHVGYVNIDQPESVNAAPPSSFLTWRVGYVRLHGPTGETHLYTPAELDHWKQRIARFASFAESTFVVFTNFHRGKSLINALQMQSLLDTIEPVQPLTPLRPASGPARMRRAA